MITTEAQNSVLDQRRERPWPWGEHLRGNWSDLLNLYGEVKIKEKDASKMQWQENKEQIQGQCEMLLLVKTVTAMSVWLSADLSKLLQQCSLSPEAKQGCIISKSAFWSIFTLKY